MGSGRRVNDSRCGESSKNAISICVALSAIHTSPILMSLLYAPALPTKTILSIHSLIHICISPMVLSHSPMPMDFAKAKYSPLPAHTIIYTPTIPHILNTLDSHRNTLLLQIMFQGIDFNLSIMKHTRC